ncbi:hypothetical protein GIB67_033853 [Kingdonia uniflora]|uniref:Uncharacterized protein n=1 Tax=Kingdonia uniflora TaxID=39325 RepID=A0A7J7LIE3_9MAGN|nr:hypothetical protein GIB67_033853 [Kingdonia uniflora]
MEEKQRESLKLFISPNSSSSTSSSKAQLFIAGESPRERERERERGSKGIAEASSTKAIGLKRKLSGALTDLTSIMLHSAAKVHYGTSLSTVDWLHGGAESLLTVTNLSL